MNGLLHRLDRVTGGRGARRLLLGGMLLVVLVLHLWVGHEWSMAVQSWKEQGPPIESVEVSVAGMLQPLEPVKKSRPAPVVLPPSTTEDEAALAPEGAASDAQAPVSAVAQGPSASGASAASGAFAPESAPVPEPPVSPAVTAAEQAAVADPWPPSTRIRYSLRGNFRGEFSGQAQVLWLRDGERYRVELEVSIGPRAAPIASRRVVSEGRLGPAGLTPRRYEEDTRVIFSRARRVTMLFDPGTGNQAGSVLLQDGKRRAAPAGTQDSASQFVQLAWLFGTHPTPVKAGDRVSFPLALSRRSDQWTYVVGDPVVVDTPAGPVSTIHARPQRELDPLKRELIAEIWFAPSLQYLPVRMQVAVDAESYALLAMDGLPELVGPVSLGPQGATPAPPSQPAAPSAREAAGAVVPP